ncbi:hypothetical protein JMN32_24120 [Fulvivirga sp. 29W222]|uniref:Outer membrane protein beta-barrel domain-containing protein n=1 Tax=Fulvivirga marina TaxID=2494733 RepID=A0A937KGH5_9BACT|nr:hypothetical protein [Fulvivirga marina]MBL6449420.1 hypothetical protein [Fulvivirga marina]
MKNRVILTTLLIVAGAANAQVDKIYFKDRSAILGRLLSLNHDSVFVRFGGENQGFRAREIHSIVLRSDMQPGVDLGILDSLNKSSFVKKFDKEVLMGVMWGGGLNNNDVYPTVSILGSYRFKRFLQVGLGMGYEEYNYYANVPVYLCYKGDLFSRFSRVYYYAGAGYSKMWGKSVMKGYVDEIKGGKLFKLGFGFIFDTKSKVDFIAAVGWSRQEMKEEYPLNYIWGEGDYVWGGGGKTEMLRTMDRLEFKIGICF